MTYSLWCCTLHVFVPHSVQFPDTVSDSGVALFKMVSRADNCFLFTVWHATPTINKYGRDLWFNKHVFIYEHQLLQTLDLCRFVISHGLRLKITASRHYTSV